MEYNNPFILYLRRGMIFDNLSSVELKSLLDKKIAELSTQEEKTDLLKKVKSLQKVHQIDETYKGGIMEFFSYVQYRIEEAENDNIHKDWGGLHKDLIGKYLKDVSLVDFNEVMNFKRLPNGKEKIVWIGKKKTEAVTFSIEFNFTLKEFNESFIYKDKSNFRKQNLSPQPPKASFVNLLTIHKH